MRRAVLSAAALLVVLAGCGGDPKADPSPTPTPSAPVTSPVSTTPSAPVMPEEANADTKAGAIAFVKYYIELINHAQATGDVVALEAVEDPACKSCQSARSGVASHYQAGGSVDGGEWRVHSASAVQNGAISGWVVDANVAYGRQIVHFGSGKPDKVNEAGRMILSIQVERSNDQWQVHEWTRAS